MPAIAIADKAELASMRRQHLQAGAGRRATSDLELGVSSPGHKDLNLREAREAVERELVERAMRRNQGKISRAATDLGVSRPTLYELIEKLGIKRK